MKTLLVLDDEHIVRQSFVDYFEDRSWHVVQAETAEQALTMLETVQPAAALALKRSLALFNSQLPNPKGEN